MTAQDFELFEKYAIKNYCKRTILISSENYEKFISLNYKTDLEIIKKDWVKGIVFFSENCFLGNKDVDFETLIEAIKSINSVVINGCLIKVHSSNEKFSLDDFSFIDSNDNIYLFQNEEILPVMNAQPEYPNDLKP